MSEPNASSASPSTNLAEIKDLSVSFITDAGSIKAVDGVSFTIPRGTVVGVVGESGSGKSVTARSIIKLLPETATTSGAVMLSKRDGTGELDVLSLSGEDLQRMRGSEAAMVFQEPNSVLNPVYTIGWQIEEGLRAHGMKDKKQLRAKAIDILKKVGIPDAETRVDYYPHQFSGGQKQRIVIAMALVLNPGLILADEPTTALDVTIQAQILQLLKEMQVKYNLTIVLITHDLGVVANIADRVAVMYAGQIVEMTDTVTLFSRPRHPYTYGLMGSLPNEETAGTTLEAIKGSPPNLAHLPEGCPFSPRCKYACDLCRRERPALTEVEPGHLARCHRLDVTASFQGLIEVPDGAGRKEDTPHG